MNMFHAPPGPNEAGHQLIATWNVGGMTLPKVMEFLKAFGGDKTVLPGNPPLSWSRGSAHPR